MEENRRKGRAFMKRARIGFLIWTCICLTMISSASSRKVSRSRSEISQTAAAAVAGEDEESILQSPSVKSRNVISESEQVAFESLKKHGTKKAELQDKPSYPKSQARGEQSKRSGIPADHIAVNGTLSLSFLDSSTEEDATGKSTATNEESTTDVMTGTTLTDTQPQSESSTSFTSDKSETIGGNELGSSNAESTTPVLTTEMPSTVSTILDDDFSTKVTSDNEESTLTTLTSSTTSSSTPITTLTLSPISTTTTTTTIPTTGTTMKTRTTAITSTTDSTTETTATTTATPISPLTTTMTMTMEPSSSSTTSGSTTSEPTTLPTSAITEIPAPPTTSPSTTSISTTTTASSVSATTITTVTRGASTTSTTTTKTTTSTPLQEDYSSTASQASSTMATLTDTPLASPSSTSTIAKVPSTITTEIETVTNTPRSTTHHQATTTSSTKVLSSSTTTLAPETSSKIASTSTATPAKKVTMLLKIVFKGSWNDICSKLSSIRSSLVELVNNHSEKKINSEQIVFHDTKCSESSTSPRLASDDHLITPLRLYATDEHKQFDKHLTHLILLLYEKTHPEFSIPVESIGIDENNEVEEEEAEHQEQEKIVETGNIAIIIAVSCIGFVFLIVLAALIFIMRKRQGRFNYGERCRPVSLDAYSLDSVSAYSSVRRSKLALRSSKRSYGNPTFEDSGTVPTHPLNFAGLTSFSNDLNSIAEEFSGIPQVSSKIDELPPGADVKNRYANVIPLPETRVPLQRLNNDPLTEYINASYVRGPKNASKYYIASQAPTEATVCDFWRMIWEQQVKVIIMLTDLVENGVEKCVEYVPPFEVSDCHRLYGDYQVTLKKREAKDKYAISSLHLKNLENNTFREVYHIWYLWPVNGVPSDPSALIAVLIETQVLQRGASLPILIHCSPGTGRTGTLIALDLAIKQYDNTRTVDIPRVVYTIRRDRAGAVQTKEQYAFIYKAINQYASKLTGGAVDSP